jgi:hypothetical protein
VSSPVTSFDATVGGVGRNRFQEGAALSRADNRSMCTLTLLRQWPSRPGAPPFRVVFSRDEQRSRPRAYPPEWRQCGATRALHPLDPQGGGTWIAVTEHGLVLALLNGNAASPPGGRNGSPKRSRGAIIPAIAAAGSRTAAETAVDVDPREFESFHLVLADDREIVDVTSDGRTLVRGSPCAGHWLMRTSSSFETAAVCAWRRRRFDEIATPASAREQDAFHEQSEPDRPAYGVAMARADACTVSITTIEVFAGEVRMSYEDTRA